MRTRSVLIAFSLVAVTLLAGGFASPAAAQVISQPIREAIPDKGLASGCDDGIVRDDGTFENALAPAGGTNGALVQRFTPPAGLSPEVEEVCLCFFRLNGAPATVDFDIVAYDNDGPGDSPGTLLASLPATVTFNSINTTTFFNYPLPPGLNVPLDEFYLGIGDWDATQNGLFFLCHDITDTGGEPEPAFVTSDPAMGFTRVSDLTDHNALGVRVKLAEVPTLTSLDAWILPGFEVDIGDPDGPTVQFAIRNQTDGAQLVDLNLYGRALSPLPLQDFTVGIGAQGTQARDVRFNLSNLEVRDGFATGLATARVSPGGPDGITADYFRIDTSNAFATGNRWVHPNELCNTREARLVDFGGGTIFRILLDQPQGPRDVSFSYKVYDFNGTEVTELGFATSQHYLELDTSELMIDIPFGTVVFDYSPAGGGWVSARYSAFGQFSTEVVGGCQ